MSITKVALKIKLRNQGIEIKPRCYLSSGSVICSFTLPPPVMRKYKKLSLIFENKKALFDQLLQQFNFVASPLNQSWTSEKLEEFIAENSVELTKKWKHEDYLFNSCVLTENQYEKLLVISKYYRISRSSLIRVLISGYKEFI